MAENVDTLRIFYPPKERPVWASELTYLERVLDEAKIALREGSSDVYLRLGDVAQALDELMEAVDHDGEV